MLTQPTPEPRDAYPGPAAPPPAPERRPSLTPVALFVVLLVAYVLIQVQLVLILTLLALLFATVIERPVQLLERRRVPRGLGILAVYVGIIGSLVLLGVLIAPTISDQGDHFRERAPAQIESLEESWRESGNPLLSGAGAELLDNAVDAIERPPAPEGDTAITVLTGVGGGVVGLLTVLVIAFYYLMEKALLRRLVLLEIRPEGRARANRIWDAIEDKVGRWLRGQLTLCLIIGATATIGYGIIGVEFWPLLGLWAGITEIIPIIGPWIGGVPAVIIALTHSWQQAMIVTGFIVLIQLMENTVLVPRVMKGAVGLTPLTIFVAILAGTELMGPAGAVLAIPVAALIQVLLTDYFDARRGANRGAAGTAPGWRWMRGPLSLSVAPPAPSPVDPGELARSAPAAPPAPSAATGSPAPPPAGAAGPPGWTSDLLARAAHTTLEPAPEPKEAVGKPEKGGAGGRRTSVGNPPDADPGLKTRG